MIQDKTNLIFQNFCAEMTPIAMKKEVVALMEFVIAAQVGFGMIVQHLGVRF